MSQIAEFDSTAVRNLNEVTVTGEKPKIKGDNGALTVDLPSIVKGKPVTNILEALGYLPGVVNQGGMIGLAGTSYVTIIINGEVQNMPVETLYQMLYSMPVDRLKNVEIMYAAPAKYHVNGAVINVILKTPGVLDGLQGQVRAGYDQRHYDSWDGGLSAIYTSGPWTFDVNYQLSKSRSWEAEDFDSNHTIGNKAFAISENNHREGRALSNLIHASTTHTDSTTGTFRLTYNGLISLHRKVMNITDGTFGLFENLSTYSHPTEYHNIAASWQSRFGLRLVADYTRYSEDRRQILFSKEADAITVDAANSQHISRLHFAVDQTHLFGGWELNYGAECRITNDRSSQEYFIPEEPGFRVDAKELTANIYIGTSKAFPWGLSFSASAKNEYYNYAGQHSWNFVPQLGATYHKTLTSIFQLNFTSQRVYPSYWETHGGTGYLDRYSIVTGNPDLRPYMNYASQFNYIFKQKYAATLYWLYHDKYFVQLPYQKPDELALVFQTVNIDYNQVAGLQLYVPLSPGSWLNSAATVNLSYNRTKASHFHDISFDRKKATVYASLSNTIRFAKGFPVSFTIDASYNSPSLQGLADMTALWRIDAGAKWTFGRGDCAELNIKANDIFNLWSPTMTIKNDTQDYRMRIHDMSRSFSIALTWRFNGFKPNPSTLDTSRFGTGK